MRVRRASWVDLILAVGVISFLIGLVDLGSTAATVHETTEPIDLSPWALPRYTFYSLSRGLIAYCLSLIFTLVYGYWAAKDKRAGSVLLPMLDILQSIPVLSFMPGVLLTFRALFPTNNIGLEIAAILLIFTGQAWNMTFSFYHSLMSIPTEQREVASVYRFTWWERLMKLELPFSTMGLVWNSMMSMAGGWFFLTACESFELKKQSFRIPGIGSYMKEAIDKSDVPAQLWAILAMVLMIVSLDQLLWRPIVVWAQKFRTEEGAGASDDSSWFLDLLRRSRFLVFIERIRKLRSDRALDRAAAAAQKASANVESTVRVKSASDKPIAAQHEVIGPTGSLIVLGLMAAAMLWGMYQLVDLMRQVTPHQWGRIFVASGLTLTRVLASTAIGTVIAVPIGLAIGLSPKLARLLQPVVQVAASFPMPMLYPLAIGAMLAIGMNIEVGSVFLMLLGTMWYILFNVIAGAMAIPSDLREAATSFHILGRQRFWVVYAPGIFPYLVTGWVTAAGGAWNASILAEYVTYDGGDLVAHGLGALINEATAKDNYPLLSAATFVMAILVVSFNRAVWRRLYRLAETRFSLSK